MIGYTHSMLEITIHLHHHFGDQSEGSNHFLSLVKEVLHEVHAMSAQLDALTAAVAQNTTITESAITLITGLKAQLDAAIANGSDPAALVALSDSIGAETAKLAAAVSANTPTPAP